MISDTEAIEAHVAVYFRVEPSARKFNSPDNQRFIVNRMKSYGLIPSDTGVARAIAELVNKGTIERTDGGTAESDAAAARAADQARIDKLANAPLTEKDFDTFVRMMPAELERRYFSDEAFRIRYDRACRDWGFKKPLPTPTRSVEAF